MSKHFSTWRVTVLSGAGGGRNSASKMFVREEKIKRGHAKRPVRFRSVAAGELQPTKSEVCVWRFRGSFFPPQFWVCKVHERGGGGASLPPRLHPHLIFLICPPCARRFLFHFCAKAEKREIKNVNATFVGRDPIRMSRLFRRWWIADRNVAGFFFSRPLLLAKIKQITGRIFAIFPQILKLFQPSFSPRCRFKSWAKFI